MQDLILALLGRPENSGALISILLMLATGLAIIRIVRMLDEEIRALRASELWNSMVESLHGLFDWPVFSWMQPRRRDRAKSGEAVVSFLGALLGLLLYIGVAIALIYRGEGLARPFEQSAAGILFLVAAIAFARASMIAAMKRWYGIL